MRRGVRPLLGLGFFLLLFALAVGCRQEVEPLFRRNQPPETTITIIPEDSTTGFYRYHVYWHGEDSDGRVIRYIFAITDTISRDEDLNWDPQTAEDRERSFYTEKTDSVFIFNSARGRLAFNIAAIDDFGRLDRTPARAYFFVTDNGFPSVQFLEVTPSRPEIPPCGAEYMENNMRVVPPCSVASFTSFRVRFRGITNNNRITGYQWQSIRPGEITPEPVQPFANDSTFLEAGRDTTGLGFLGDTLFTLRNDVVTVYYTNTLLDSIPAGTFQFRARVRDESGRVSPFSLGTRRVVVNYDPDTEIVRVPACDCPNAPPNCSSRPPQRAGWLRGVDQVVFADSSQWRLFCDGDTLPQLAMVRTYARGHDDARDIPISPSGLREVGFSYRFEWFALNSESRTQPSSDEWRPRDYVLPPPLGTMWRGGATGWGGPSSGLCPFSYRLFAAAVDEHGTRDGTPDSLTFHVGSAPTLEAVVADSTVIDAMTPFTLVLVPRCPAEFPSFCPNIDSLTFGPDTLAVLGTHLPGANPIFVLDPGLNRFWLPLRAIAYDHPRDRDSLYTPETRGRVRSWFYTFDCISGCEDLLLPSENQWVSDSLRSDDPEPGRSVFDKPRLEVRMVLDTLCTAPAGVPCPGAFKVALPTANLGDYAFSVQGRDTEALGSICREPSDLGPNPSQFTRQISELGIRTSLERRTIRLRQLQEVRPYVPKPMLPTTASGTSKSNRKRWWR